MNICGNKYDEIVFEGRNCPLCDLIAEKEELEQEIAKLEELNELKKK